MKGRETLLERFTKRTPTLIDRLMISARSLFVCLAVVTVTVSTAADRPPEWRSPLPPWPERSLARFGWDEGLWFGPVRFHPTNTDRAVRAPSWSGHALGRGQDEEFPVAIPALDAQGWPLVGADSGAVRFWFKPNWNSAAAKSDKRGWTKGSGPGQPARLLEMVNLGGPLPDVRWTLHATADGRHLRVAGCGRGCQRRSSGGRASGDC